MTVMVHSLLKLTWILSLLLRASETYPCTIIAMRKKVSADHTQ